MLLFPLKTSGYGLRASPTSLFYRHTFRWPSPHFEPWLLDRLGRVRLQKLHHLRVPTFARVINRRLALIANAVNASTVFKEHQDQVLLPRGCSLQQRSISAVLGRVYVGSAFEQHTSYIL